MSAHVVRTMFKPSHYHQLVPFRTNGILNTPAPPRRPQKSKNWAQEFLGGAPLVREGSELSLDGEIEAYLADRGYASTALRFWQVCASLHLNFALLDVGYTGKQAQVPNYLPACP